MASFPATLPAPRLDDYALDALAQTVRTEMEVGAPRVRRRTRARLDRARLSWVLTDEQMLVLRSWIESQSYGAGGAAWNSMTLAVGDGGFRTCEVRIAGDWRARLLSGTPLWLVEASAEIRGGELTEHQMRGAVLGYVRDNVYPTLVLEFAQDKTLDPICTITRGSVGAYWGSDGLVYTAAANVARFTHDPATKQSLGILCEEQCTNYLTYSQDYTQAAWIKTNCTISANVGPLWQSGAASAKIVENTAAGEHGISMSVSGLSNNAVHTLSVQVAAAGRTQVLLNAVRKDGTSASALFTLSGSGSVSGETNTLSTAIRQENGAFYRCEITFDVLSGATTPAASIKLASGGSTSYTGDGSNGIYLAHAQLEAGTEATSPIFTTGADATRSADSISITGSNFTSWFNATEGTILVEGKTNRRYANANTFPRLCSFNGNSTNNDIRLLYRVLSPYTDFDAVVAAGGVTQAQATTGQNETTTRWVLAYKANDFAFAGRGVLLGTDTSGTVPTVSQMNIGSSPLGDVLNGTIARTVFWPKRLANTHLPGLAP